MDPIHSAPGDGPADSRTKPPDLKDGPNTRLKSDPDRKDQLLDSALVLASDLSLQVVLQRIIDLAVNLTDARYGALGVIGPDGRLRDFITTGITPAQRRAIGPLPVGEGILGVLIRDAKTFPRAFTGAPRNDCMGG